MNTEVSLEDIGKIFDGIESSQDQEQPEEQIAESGAGEGKSASQADENKDQTGEEAAKPADEQPLEPHPRWSQRDKEIFAKLPREGQQAWLDRQKESEAEFTRKTQELAEQRKGIEPLHKIMEIRREEALRYGATPDQLVSHVMGLWDEANQDPAGFIQRFAAQHNIDLGNVQSGESEYVDPSVKALEQKVNQLLQASQNQANNAEQEKLNQHVEMVKSFSSQEANKYFADVQSDITLMIQAVKRENPALTPQEVLKEAYDRACYANPAVRAKIFAEKQAKDDADRKAKEAEAAKRARDAQGKFVKGSGESNKGHAEARSIDETMARVYDKVNGAA